jgi:hypothetical protein
MYLTKRLRKTIELMFNEKNKKKKARKKKLR